MKSIETDRLILRKWQEQDLAPFASINQDPLVMKYFTNPLTTAQTAETMERYNSHIEQHGFGFWACVSKQTQELLGFVGLSMPNFETHFTPCVEIGWRLASKHWNHGYATEAAKVALQNGFKQHRLTEIVAFTVPQNVRSWHVMEKIGMQRDHTGDFSHPNISKDHPLNLHILYRIKK